MDNVRKILRAAGDYELLAKQFRKLSSKNEVLKQSHLRLINRCESLISCLNAARAYPETSQYWQEEIKDAEQALSQAKKVGK